MAIPVHFETGQWACLDMRKRLCIFCSMKYGDKTAFYAEFPILGRTIKPMKRLSTPLGVGDIFSRTIRVYRG